MKKSFLSITLLSILILFTNTSITSANNLVTLFYDDFNNGDYTDNWSVEILSSESTITESGSDLHLYSEKTGNKDGEAAFVLTKTYFSSHNITVEARIKPLGWGGIYLMIYKDGNNYIRFGLTTDDVSDVEVSGHNNGVWFANPFYYCDDGRCEGYFNDYHTWTIKKIGNLYETYIDGVFKGSYTHNFIGDTNLRVGLWNQTFPHKSGAADTYIDYVNVDGQPQCPSWATSGCPECSCTPVTLDEMGSFDNGGGWAYNSSYLTDMSQWGQCNASAQPAMWEPKRVVIWNASPFGAPNLDVQYKPSGFATRARLQLPQVGISYPEVYRWIYPNGNTHAFSAQFQCSPNTQPGTCCPPGFINAPLETIPFERIDSICWLQKDMIKGCVTQDNHPNLFDLITENFMNLSYDFQNPPNAPNYSPTRGKYSFWPPPNGPWRYQDFPVIYALVGIGQAPALNVPSTLRVRINGTDHDLQFIGGDTTKPPMVLTYTTNQGKKPQTKQQVWAYENGGNLIIKWQEPADLLEPYWQIRVIIGNSNAVGNETGTIPASPVTYAIVEVPPPSTTAVLPEAAWTALKNAIGAGTVRISIWYRRYYQNAPPTGGGEVMQVRSQSDYLEH